MSNIKNIRRFHEFILLLVILLCTLVFISLQDWIQWTLIIIVGLILASVLIFWWCLELIFFNVSYLQVFFNILGAGLYLGLNFFFISFFIELNLMPVAYSLYMLFFLGLIYILIALNVWFKEYQFSIHTNFCFFVCMNWPYIFLLFFYFFVFLFAFSSEVWGFTNFFSLFFAELRSGAMFSSGPKFWALNNAFLNYFFNYSSFMGIDTINGIFFMDISTSINLFSGGDSLQNNSNNNLGKGSNKGNSSPQPKKFFELLLKIVNATSQISDFYTMENENSDFLYDNHLIMSMHGNKARSTDRALKVNIQQKVDFYCRPSLHKLKSARELYVVISNTEYAEKTLELTGGQVKQITENYNDLRCLHIEKKHQEANETLAKFWQNLFFRDFHKILSGHLGRKDISAISNEGLAKMLMLTSNIFAKDTYFVPNIPTTEAKIFVFADCTALKGMHDIKEIIKIVSSQTQYSSYKGELAWFIKKSQLIVILDKNNSGALLCDLLNNKIMLLSVDKHMSESMLEFLVHRKGYYYARSADLVTFEKTAGGSIINPQSWQLKVSDFILEEHAIYMRDHRYAANSLFLVDTKNQSERSLTNVNFDYLPRIKYLDDNLNVKIVCQYEENLQVKRQLLGIDASMPRVKIHAKSKEEY